MKLRKLTLNLDQLMQAGQPQPQRKDPQVRFTLTPSSELGDLRQARYADRIRRPLRASFRSHQLRRPDTILPSIITATGLVC